jgi:hypothetical protein
MQNYIKEGPVAKAIEKQTAKLPSDVFLWAAVGAMGVALFLKTTGRKTNGLMIGQLAGPLLIMGLYNKFVKTHGHDSTEG